MSDNTGDNEEVEAAQERTANLLSAMGDVFRESADPLAVSIDRLDKTMSRRFEQLRTTRWVLALAASTLILDFLLVAFLVVFVVVKDRQDTDARNARQACTETVKANWQAVLGEIAVELNPSARQARGLEPATPQETLAALQRLDHASQLSNRIPEICLTDHPDPTPLDR